MFRVQMRHNGPFFLFCSFKLLIVFGWIKASNCCCVQDHFGDFLSCYAPFKLKAQQFWI